MADSYIDRGCTVVKKKIGGASLDEDLRRIDSILSVLQDGQKLAVDANGRFDLDTAIRYAKALSQYDLFWYEEPGDPLDFELLATLRNDDDKPMATGEDLFSMQDARNLIRYGGMRPDRDWLPFDCALSYGLVEYLRTLDSISRRAVNAPTKKTSSQRSQNNERTPANSGTRATTVDSAVGARPDFTIDAGSTGQNASTFLKNAPTSLRIADWKNDRPKR
ncbi:hypothethical protein, Enolase domain [Ralstonia solanacearum PSI07]|nr:hypothethical protein, Enolase domain [Ralstonia solanacearum PSI07]